jgi:hypothetical protein
MKAFIILSAALLTISSFGFQFDSSSAVIETAHFDKFSNLSKRVFETGMVRINKTTNTIILSLEFESNCGTDRICARMNSNTLQYILPITDQDVDECGVVYYKAYENKIPVDGNETVITVTDYSKNTCPTFGINPETSVAFTSKGFYWRRSEVQTISHYFTAATLEQDASVGVPISI